MRRPWRQTERRCHCQSKLKKGRNGRVDGHMTKKNIKKGAYAVREKQKLGRRQVPRGGAGDGGVWRGRDRKKDEGAPCCESVSDSPLRSCEHRLRMRSQSQSPSLPHFPYIIPNFPVQMNNFTCTFFSTYCTHSPSLPLSLAVSLPLSLIRGHFYFKAPPLSPISEGN